MKSSRIADVRLAILALLCLVVAFGATAASIVDSLDGDDDGSPPGGELPVLPVGPRCSPPPPSETGRVQAPSRDPTGPHTHLPGPLSLRAPPAP
jgi:hypothetical protein